MLKCMIYSNSDCCAAKTYKHDYDDCIKNNSWLSPTTKIYRSQSYADLGQMPWTSDKTLFSLR